MVAILALKRAYTPQGDATLSVADCCNDSEQAISVEPDFSGDKMDNLS